MPVLALLSMSALASLVFLAMLLGGGAIGDAVKAWVILGFLGLMPAVYHSMATPETPTDF